MPVTHGRDEAPAFLHRDGGMPPRIKEAFIMALDKHIQSVLQAVVIALLTFFGNTLMQVREDVAGLKASDAANRDSVKRIESDIRTVREGMSTLPTAKEFDGVVKRVERLEDLYRRTASVNPKGGN